MSHIHYEMLAVNLQMLYYLKEQTTDTTIFYFTNGWFTAANYGI